MEIIRPIWVIPLNFLGDRIRHMINAGPKWRMHLRLARRLVDKQSWFMIPLTSGMQSPIFDAIEYLVANEDRDSIVRLESLFEKYVGSQQTIRRERLDVGTVTYCYGPQDYVPLSVQWCAAKALCALYNHTQASEFATKYLTKDMRWRLGESALRELLASAVRLRLDVPEDVLTHAFDHLYIQVTERAHTARGIQNT